MSDLLAVGSTAPTFALPSTRGPIDLAAYRAAKKNVVLCFYPGDDTPG